MPHQTRAAFPASLAREKSPAGRPFGPWADENTNSDDKLNSEDVAWPLHDGDTQKTQTFVDVMNYRIYANAYSPAPRRKDGIISTLNVPTPLTFRGRFVVPCSTDGPHSAPPCRILPRLHAWGFSGLVRTLKRTLLRVLL